jgi:hypothetical protein
MLTSSSSSKSSLYTLALTGLVLSCLTAAALSYNVMGPKKQRGNEDDKTTKDHSLGQCTESGGAISIAFLGNSILYFNDCPRLVQHMLQQRFSTVVQDSCLRGGATLPSLLDKGNGMRDKFQTPPAVKADGKHDIGAATVKSLLSEKWDFVVLNDYTQAPVRQETKQATLDALRDTYSKLFQQAGATPVFLETFAYRYPDMKGTKDLGDFIQFSERLTAGYIEYAETLSKLLPETPCRIARAGQAFQWLFTYNHNLWEKLFSWDDFHPSPHGTWLEACCIYCAVVNEAPPSLDSQWWEAARRMQPSIEKPMALPTVQESEELRRVACFVSGVNAEAFSASRL